MARNMCDVCGQNQGKKKIIDGVVCKECLEKTPLGKAKITSSFSELADRKKITVGWVRDSIQSKKASDQRLEQFQISEQVGKVFAIDKIHNWFLVFPDTCLPCDEIIDYDLVENGNTVNKSGLGSAVVGGALFGGAGALIGYSMGKKQVQEVTSLYIKIITRIEGYSDVKIELISSSVKSNSRVYKVALERVQKIMSILAVATNDKDATNQIEQTNQDTSISVADELMKLSQLLDNGVLTQEEFDEQKKKLLSS